MIEVWRKIRDDCDRPVRGVEKLDTEVVEVQKGAARLLCVCSMGDAKRIADALRAVEEESTFWENFKESRPALLGRDTDVSLSDIADGKI